MEDFIAKGSRRRALLLASLGFFVGFAGVSAYGPIVPILKRSMMLGPLMAGFLAAAPALTGSLLRIPFGAMVDRAGGKRPIMILLILSMIGIGLIALLFSSDPNPSASSYWMFVALGMLAGSGIAVFSVGVASVSYWYPQKSQGTALAIYGGFGNVAPGIFAILLPLLVSAVGLTASYAIWLAALFIFVVFFCLFMHDAPYFQLKANGFEIDREDQKHRDFLHRLGQELVPGGHARESLSAAAREPRTWLLTGIYFVTFGGFIALTAWFPIYWSALFEFGLVLAGTMTAVYSIATSLIRVAGGFLSDRIGGERLLLGSLVLVLAGSIVMALAGAGDFPRAVAASLVIAVGMGFGNAAVFKLVPKFAPKSVGGAAGIVGGLGAFGGFVIPPALGLVVNAYGGTSGYQRAFLIFAALGAAGLMMLGSLKGKGARA